jgi:hypothetical protein
MVKPGPKELQARALREARTDIPTVIRRGHPDCVVKPGPRPAVPALKAAIPAASIPAPATPEAQLENRTMKTAKKTTAAKTKSSAKKTKTAAKLKVATKKVAPEVRPGSKTAMVADLLTRPSGCTAAEVLAATGWPTVSMPQQAKAAGLTLRKEKDGKVSRYWGSATKAAASPAA